MIAAVMGGAQVLGGVAGFMSGRKERKWGRRNAAEAQRQANQRLQYMDDAIGGMASERELAMGMRDDDIARYNSLGYDAIEQDMADQVRRGIDVEGRAQTAADEFTNQYDVSLDAQRRAMTAQGVRPGSSAMARLGEDAAYDRARGAATQGNQARRQADDQNFARRLAFSNRGQQARNNILNQGANIAGQFRGEYGMQGAIRSEYLGERNNQQARAEQGRAAMAAGAQAIGMGGLGAAQSGALGAGAQQSAMDFIRVQG